MKYEVVLIFTDDETPEPLTSQEIKEELEKPVPLAGTSVEIKSIRPIEAAEFILGVSSYGGVQEVKRTTDLAEAEAWVSQPSDTEDTMKVYQKVLDTDL